VLLVGDWTRDSGSRPLELLECWVVLELGHDIPLARIVLVDLH